MGPRRSTVQQRGNLPRSMGQLPSIDHKPPSSSLQSTFPRQFANRGPPSLLLLRILHSGARHNLADRSALPQEAAGSTIRTASTPFAWSLNPGKSSRRRPLGQVQRIAQPAERVPSYGRSFLDTSRRLTRPYSGIWGSAKSLSASTLIKWKLLTNLPHRIGCSSKIWGAFPMTLRKGAEIRSATKVRRRGRVLCCSLPWRCIGKCSFLPR